MTRFEKVLDGSDLTEMTRAHHLETNCDIFLLKICILLFFLDFVRSWTLNIKKFWMMVGHGLSTSVEHDPVSGSRSNRILQFSINSGVKRNF